jgi:hypothetical protein
MPSTFEFPGLPIPVFTIGPPLAPKIKHDDGHLGVFPSRRPTAADYAELTRWVARLEVGEAVQGVPFLPKSDLPDALAAYRHFCSAKENREPFHTSATSKTIRAERSPSTMQRRTPNSQRNSYPYRSSPADPHSA